MGDLKLGYNTGYWAKGPPAGVDEAIDAADSLGVDSIWCAEAYGSDCLTPLAWWGSRTKNVRAWAPGSCSCPRASRPRPRWPR